jgi:hypothetical protein
VRSPGALAVYYNAFDDEPASYDVVTGRVQLYDCQQSALFVSESIALQELATVAGGAMATAAIPMLKEQSAAMSARINGSLWDEETGIYRQRDASNQSRGFSPVLSPTSFYPMMAGIPSTAQAERMVANHLTNSSEFCVDPGAEFETETSVQGACPFAIPSISRDNPNFWDNTCVPVVFLVFVLLVVVVVVVVVVLLLLLFRIRADCHTHRIHPSQCVPSELLEPGTPGCDDTHVRPSSYRYWRGRIWGPLNLLVWLSLSHEAYADTPRIAAARKGLCGQAHAALMVEWRARRHVHENLNATTAIGWDVPNSNPFYHVRTPPSSPDQLRTHN